jgi:lysyl-tRNA synthetase class 2
MLEFYWAYADVNQMMDFCEKLLRSVVYTVSGHTHVRYGEHEIDFSQPFQRMSMKEAIVSQIPTYWRNLGGEELTIDWLNSRMRVDRLNTFISSMEREITEVLGSREKEFLHLEGEELEAKIHAIEDEVRVMRKDQIWSDWDEWYRAKNDDNFIEDEYGVGIVRLFEYFAECDLIQPTFITDFPKPISPLSKASPRDASIAERFEYFVGALESANGFSELNDPEEQFQRFKDQELQRQRGDEEAMVMDEDYIRALSYGMPPAAGIGVGIDRLVMLLTNKHSIRDVILFPHMRPEKQKAEGSEQPNNPT